MWRDPEDSDDAGQQRGGDVGAAFLLRWFLLERQGCQAGDGSTGLRHSSDARGADPDWGRIAFLLERLLQLAARELTLVAGSLGAAPEADRPNIAVNEAIHGIVTDAAEPE